VKSPQAVWEKEGEVWINRELEIRKKVIQERKVELERFWKYQIEELDITEELGKSAEGGTFNLGFRFEGNGYKPGAISMSIRLGKATDRVLMRWEGKNNIIFIRRDEDGQEKARAVWRKSGSVWKKRRIVLVGVESNLAEEIAYLYPTDVMVFSTNEEATNEILKLSHPVDLLIAGENALGIYKILKERNMQPDNFYVRTENRALINQVIDERNGTPQALKIALPRADGDSYFDFLERIQADLDGAMRSDTGGIDLTSDQALSVKNDGQGITFHIDPAQLRRIQNTSGFTPVIIGIEPLVDLSKFLGI
jgi:hypothetical protein